MTDCSTPDTILIVEDEVPVRSLMTRWAMTAGYRVALAASATQALEEMSRTPAAVAVCDICMPGRDGLWLAQELRTRHPDTAVIIASALGDFETAVRSMRSGAIEYLHKPIAQTAFQDALRRAVGRHKAALETRGRCATLDAELHRRQEQLIEAVTDARINSLATVDSLLQILTYQDLEVYEHVQRVSRMTIDTALLLGVTEPLLSHIERAALLHDIARIAMPTTVRNQTEFLDESELAILRRQPEIGYEILKKVPFLSRAAEIILAVDEWYNGQGHPYRLAGRQIPLGSRIISVADAYDTLTEPSPAVRTTPDNAIAELERYRNTRFDPSVLDTFKLSVTLADASHVADFPARAS